MSFQSWAADKKVKDRDLVFLRALKNPHHQDLFEKVSDIVGSLNPTFSEGLPVLEQLTDLILMGYADQLLLRTESFEKYKSHLKSLRYPQTTRRDEGLKVKLESLPWPYGSKVKFERRGDRAGVELKLFISTDVDLTKIVAALERVQKELS